MKPYQFLVLSGLTFLAGLFFGAVIQKAYGLGNLLRGVGVPYPTRTPLPTPGLELDEIPRDYQGEMALFILAGQSNMVGWAPLPEDQVKDPKIYVFGNDYHWRIAVEPVDDASGQVDDVSADPSAGFGPSLAFASAVRSSRPEMVVGLIPCAKSSSAIIEWQRNLSDQSLYGSCLKQARAASPMGHFAGILFFQGETDAVDANLYPQYQPNPMNWSELFSKFVSNLREDLGEPELPVVFAQIGANTSLDDVPNWELVQAQQHSTRLPMSGMIVTDDLPLLDGLHFTAESYRIIGNRFAEAYLDLLQDE